MSEDLVLVEMTVKVWKAKGEEPYQSWETLAEFSLPNHRPAAFLIYQRALAEMVAPRVAVTVPSAPTLTGSRD